MANWDFQTRLAIGSFGLGAAAGGTAGAAYLSPNLRATMVAMSKAGAARTGTATVKTAQATQAAFRAGYASAKFGGRLAPPAGRFLGRGAAVGAAVGRFGFGVATSPVGRFAGRAASFGIRKILFPLAVLGAVKGGYEGTIAGGRNQTVGEAVWGGFKGAVRGFVGL